MLYVWTESEMSSLYHVATLFAVTAVPGAWLMNIHVQCAEEKLNNLLKCLEIESCLNLFVNDYE